MNYQDRLAAFHKYVTIENVEDRLIYSTKQYCEYIWGRTYGLNLDEILDSFPPQLHLDTAMHLFHPAFKNMKVSEKHDIRLFRLLALNVRKRIVPKDLKIIRCNDVQSNIFIILKGRVDIFIAHTQVATLLPGSIFGNITREPHIRQTITAVASVNSALLTLKSTIFNDILSDTGDLNALLNQFGGMRIEYMEGRLKYTDTKRNVDQVPLVYTDAHIQEWLKGKFMKMRLRITYNSKWLKWLHYIICMYVAPLNCMINIFMIFYQETRIRTLEWFVIYLFDAIFFIW